MSRIIRYANAGVPTTFIKVARDEKTRGRLDNDHCVFCLGREVFHAPAVRQLIFNHFFALKSMCRITNMSEFQPPHTALESFHEPQFLYMKHRRPIFESHFYFQLRPVGLVNNVIKTAPRANSISFFSNREMILILSRPLLFRVALFQFSFTHNSDSIPAAKAVAPPFAGCRTAAASVMPIDSIKNSAFFPTATILANGKASIRILNAGSP